LGEGARDFFVSGPFPKPHPSTHYEIVGAVREPPLPVPFHDKAKRRVRPAHHIFHHRDAEGACRGGFKTRPYMPCPSTVIVRTHLSVRPLEGGHIGPPLRALPFPRQPFFQALCNLLIKTRQGGDFRQRGGLDGLQVGEVRQQTPAAHRANARSLIQG